MSKIYLPSNLLNKPCYVINNGYIRVYNTINTSGNNTIYDVYVNQDYMIKQGTASYSTSTVCDNLNTYTDDYYYRVDLHYILITFVIMALICFILPFKIISRFFGRWLKV